MAANALAVTVSARGQVDMASNDTFYDPGPRLMPMDETAQRLQQYVRLMHEYYLPTIYIVAITGNVFSIVVLSDEIFRKLSLPQYLLGIVVVETIHVLALLHVWLEDIGINTGTYQIGGWCQFATLVTSSTKFLSVWYLVLLGVDRTVWMCLPGQERSVCHPWRAKIAIVSGVIVSIVVYFNISMLFGTMDAGPRLICTILPSYERTFDKLGKGDIFFNVFLPPLCLLVFLILIIWSAHFKGRPVADRVTIMQNSAQSSNSARVIISQPDATSALRGSVFHAAFVDQVGIFCALSLCYMVLSAPQDLYAIAQAIMEIASGGHSDGSLKAFLLHKIFQYVKRTKYAINAFILLAAYPKFRTATLNIGRRLAKCITLCSNNWKTNRSSDIEVALPEQV